jgi:hypothetical protein
VIEHRQGIRGRSEDRANRSLRCRSEPCDRATLDPHDGIDDDVSIRGRSLGHQLMGASKRKVM